MRNKFSLEITNPCSEKFENFTKTRKGGFCGSCNKEVIDFTGMGSQEIINYFKNNNSKKTCGKFSDYQLTTYIENQHPKKHNLLQRLGITFLSLFAFNSIAAQQTKPSTEITENSSTKNILTKTMKGKITVKGNVSDDDGPLPGASVVLQGTTIGTETDFDGNFKFSQPLKKGDILIFSFVGLETKKIIINDNSSVLNVKMKTYSCQLLGKVIVKKIYKSKKRF